MTADTPSLRPSRRRRGRFLRSKARRGVVATHRGGGRRNSRRQTTRAAKTECNSLFAMFGGGNRGAAAAPWPRESSVDARSRPCVALGLSHPGSDQPDVRQTGRESSSPACWTACLAGLQFALACYGTSPKGWLPTFGESHGNECPRMRNVPLSPVPRGPCAVHFMVRVPARVPFSPQVPRVVMLRMRRFSFFFPACRFFLSSCKSSMWGIPLASFGFHWHGCPPGKQGTA